MPDFSPSIDKAHQLLTHPESYPGLKKRSKSDRKLLIWSYPAHSVYCSWSLFVEQNANEPKNCLIRRIKWVRQGLPSEQTEPYTIGSEAVIDFQQVTAIIDRFYQIELKSLDSPNLIGIDGTIYGVEITDRRIDRYLSWWSIPPKDWQPLLIWFQNTITIFDDILPQSNVSD